MTDDRSHNITRLARWIDALQRAGLALTIALALAACVAAALRLGSPAQTAWFTDVFAALAVAILFLQLPAALRDGRLARAEVFLDGFALRHPRAGFILRAAFASVGAVTLVLIFLVALPACAAALGDGAFVRALALLAVLVGSLTTAIRFAHDVRDTLRAAATAPARAPGVES